jgi:hypothetical protein
MFSDFYGLGSINMALLKECAWTRSVEVNLCWPQNLLNQQKKMRHNQKRKNCSSGALLDAVKLSVPMLRET